MLPGACRGIRGIFPFLLDGLRGLFIRQEGGLCIPPDKPAGGEDGGAGNRKDGHKEPFGLKNFFHIAVISFFLSVYPLRFYSKVFQQRFDIIEH